MEGKQFAPDAGEQAVSPHRWHNPAAIVLLILHAALAWLNRAFVAGLWHDEAHYMLLARSLRRFRYEDFYLLGSPIHSQYPPGVPAFFGLLSLPFGEHAGVLIAGVVLCSVGTLALLYDIIKRRAGAGVALTVLALCAVNPELLLHAGRPLSESVYLLFATLALWAVSREPETLSAAGRSAFLWPALAMVAALSAAGSRMVGVTVIGAIVLAWALERRFRRAIVLTAIGALTVGGWLLWGILAPAKLPGRSYVVDATLSQHGTERSPYGLFGTLSRRVATNVPAYATRHLPKDLPQPALTSVAKRLPSSPQLARTASEVDRVVAILLLTILGTLGSWVLWKQARPVILYLLLYLALLAVWPFHLSRFLVPAVPVILWVLVAGAKAVAAHRRWLRPLPYAVAAGIFVMAVARDVSTLRDTLLCDRAQAPTSPRCYAETERGFFAAMRFIRQSTADSAVFLTSTDTQLGYFGGRRSVFSPAVARQDPATILDGLRGRGVQYVLLTPIRPPREQLVTLMRHRCSELEVVQEFPAITLVLRIVPSGTTHVGQNACDAIARYATAGIRSALW